MRQAIAQARPLPVILDADAVGKVARRDVRARGMVERLARQRDGVVVMPMVAVIQSLAEGTGERAIERLVRVTPEMTGLDMVRAWVAAHLLRDSRTTDVADALIAGEALIRVPSVLITGDPRDMRRLLDTDPRGARVAVWSV